MVHKQHTGLNSRAYMRHCEKFSSGIEDTNHIIIFYATFLSIVRIHVNVRLASLQAQQK